MKNIKPSQLLELALHDLEVVESMPVVYTVNMNQWHNAEHTTGRCLVCLAGAVMAVSLHLAPTVTTRSDNPELFSHEQQSMLRALDYFRTGNIEFGLMEMGVKRPVRCPMDMFVTPYNEDEPEEFKSHIRQIIRCLKEHDL